MTLGITIFGIIQRNRFTSELSTAFGDSGQAASFGEPRSALTPEARAQIPAPILEKITNSLSASISITFMWAIVPAVLAVVFVLLMPKDRLTVQPKDAKPASASGQR